MIGGRQKISIGRGCEYKGIVQHEILHALGRVHEQSRPDRDQFVIIDRQNIIRGMESFSEQKFPGYSYRVQGYLLL